MKRGASPLLGSLTKMYSKNLTNGSRIVLEEFCQIILLKGDKRRVIGLLGNGRMQDRR
jgi:hypothetical protein